MIVAWDSSSIELVKYALVNYRDLGVAIVFHEGFVETNHQTEDLGPTLDDVPDYVAPLVASTIGLTSQTGHGVSNLLRTNFRLFESHSQVWRHFVGEDVDRTFSSGKDSWVEGLVKAVQHCLASKRPALVIISGRNFDPSPLYLMNLLYIIGVENVDAIVVNEHGYGSKDIKKIPSSYKSPFTLSANPEVLMLLLLHNAAQGRADEPVFTNASRIAEWVLENKLSKYLPPKRKKKTRHYHGYYSYLRDMSDLMYESQLLERVSNNRKESEYTITGVGRCYLQLFLTLKASLPEAALRIANDAETIVERAKGI